MSNQAETIDKPASESKDVVMPEGEFIEVPVTLGFRHDMPPIGTVKILKSALPEKPDWVLSLGFRIEEQHVEGETTKYSLMELALISDSDFKGYLDQKFKA